MNTVANNRTETTAGTLEAGIVASSEAMKHMLQAMSALVAEIKTLKDENTELKERLATAGNEMKDVDHLGNDIWLDEETGELMTFDCRCGEEMPVKEWMQANSDLGFKSALYTKKTPASELRRQLFLERVANKNKENT